MGKIFVTFEGEPDEIVKALVGCLAGNVKMTMASSPPASDIVFKQTDLSYLLSAIRAHVYTIRNDSNSHNTKLDPAMVAIISMMGHQDKRKTATTVCEWVKPMGFGLNEAYNLVEWCMDHHNHCEWKVKE